MKYFILIFVICFTNLQAVTIPYVPAKNNIAIVVGCNFTQINNNIDYLEVESSLGNNLGVQYVWNLGEETKSLAGVDFRLSYISRSIEYEYNHPLADMTFTNFNEKNKVIQFATLYHFKFINTPKNSFQIIAGPYYNYNLNDEVNPFLNSDSIPKLEIGFSFGAGYEYNFKNYKLGIEYSYQLSLSNKYHDN
jgi:hypothetical protein